MLWSSQAEHFRAPWWSLAISSDPFERPSRAGASGHFERTSEAERARAAISSAPVEPSVSDVPNVRRCGVFEQPSRLIPSALAEPSEFEQPFRAARWTRAGSSGHFERPIGAERARAAISNAPASRAGSKSQTSASAAFTRPGRELGWKVKANTIEKQTPRCFELFGMLKSFSARSRIIIPDPWKELLVLVESR